MRSIFLGLAAALTLVSPAAESACVPNRVATLPLVSYERPVVQAMINGTPVITLVDTGSETSTVTPEAAARLKLKRNPSRQQTMLRIGGAETVGSVVAEKLSLGSATYDNLDLPVMAMRGAQNTPDGLIGADLLHDFDLDIDLPQRQITLYRAGACKGTPPWPEPYERLPLTISDRLQLLIAAKLDGHAVNLLFDTGALREAIARDVATRFGVTDAELQRDIAHKTKGPMSYSLRRHHFATLVLGPETFHDVWFDVIDFRQPNVDALIGIDYMLRRRFYISYAARTMFMQRKLPE
jgi:predicted aspartyl protease